MSLRIVVWLSLGWLLRIIIDFIRTSFSRAWVSRWGKGEGADVFCAFVYSPVDGVVGPRTKIEGQYYTVNPLAIRSQLVSFGTLVQTWDWELERSRLTLISIGRLRRECSYGRFDSFVRILPLSLLSFLSFPPSRDRKFADSSFVHSETFGETVHVWVGAMLVAGTYFTVNEGDTIKRGDEVSAPPLPSPPARLRKIADKTCLTYTKRSDILHLGRRLLCVCFSPFSSMRTCSKTLETP